MFTQVVIGVIFIFVVLFWMTKIQLPFEKKEARKRYREYRNLYPDLSPERIKSLVKNSLTDPNGPACH